VRPLATRQIREAVMRILLLAAVVLAASAVVAALIGNRQAVYLGIARLTGTGRGMGPVDFATLRRRDTPNDALVCPPGHCPQAVADWPAKTYDMPTAQLADRISRIVLAEPNTSALHCHPPCDGPMRFVQESRVMRFPDTIDIAVLPVGDDKSTLAIYSRSLLGYGDFGVNRARIARWLAVLDTLS
jgi:uncharacterized protein (DUF1499 family)